jgi:antitoxin VapB
MSESDPSQNLAIDPETGALVARIARRLGMSEADAIRQGLREFEAGLDRTHRNPNAPEWLVKFWHEHPLPPPTGLKADKAFFDWLCGEEDW